MFGKFSEWMKIYSTIINYRIYIQLSYWKMYSYLICFCLLAGVYAGELFEGDSDPLENAKKEAREKIEGFFSENSLKMMKIEEAGKEIKKKFSDYSVELDNLYKKEWDQKFTEVNEKVSQMLRTKKYTSVFECIVDCALNAREIFPEKIEESKRKLSQWLHQGNQMISEYSQKREIKEKKLNEMKGYYKDKVNSAKNDDEVFNCIEEAEKSFSEIATSLMDEFSREEKECNDLGTSTFEDCVELISGVRKDAIGCINTCFKTSAN